MFLLNKIFTHKFTIVILMVLSFYAYNNIILGGIALIIFLGLFLVYLGLVPQYDYVLVDHPYLKVKNNKIVFKRLKGLSLKVIIFGPNGLLLPIKDIPLSIKDKAAEQTLKNSKGTGELLL